MSAFWNGFKTAASEKEKLKLEAKDAESLALAGEISSALAGYASYFGGKSLVKKLLENKKGIPSELRGLDIKDLKEHTLKYLNSGGSVKKEDPYAGYFKRMFGETLDKSNPEHRKQLLEMADLGESFLKEKSLRDKGVTFNMGKGGRGVGGDYYNPLKNTVNMETVDRAIALHEMGHAADIKGSLLKTVGRAGVATTGALAVPLALVYGDTIKRRIPGTVDDKVIDFIQNHPALSSVAGYGVHTLYPEAKASYLALKHIAKQKGTQEAFKDFKHTLGPAFGTYLLAGLPLMAAGAVQGAYRKHLAEKREKKFKKDMKKKAALNPDQKAFLAGFLASGLPLGGAAYYQSKSEGGKALSDVTEEHQRQRLERTYGKSGAKPFLQMNKKIRDWSEKNPELFSALVGGGIGTLSGVLTRMMMKDMPLFKKASFQKRARSVAPPIPGPRLITGTASAIPGQGAMVMGRFGLKQAPQAIKSRGVGSTPVP